MSARRQHCFNCGEDIGPWDRFSEQMDTCGAIDCERAARNASDHDRYEAHEQLDRDMGWF